MAAYRSVFQTPRESSQRREPAPMVLANYGQLRKDRRPCSCPPFSAVASEGQCSGNDSRDDSGAGFPIDRIASSSSFSADLSRFPIHVLAPPRAGTYENNRYGGVGDEIVADNSADRLRLYSAVIDVVHLNRLVYDAVPHHSDEFLFMRSIRVVIADEDFVFRWFARRSFAPNYKTKRHAKRIVTVTMT